MRRFSGINPFQLDTSDDEEMLDNIELGDYELVGEAWPMISDQAKDLVQGLLQKNPKLRTDADEASRHAWIVLSCFNGSIVVPLLSSL